MELSTNYSEWSNAALIDRVTELERQLKEQTARYTPSPSTTDPAPSSIGRKSDSPPRAFDPSKYSTRHIALKFAYLGQNYFGYEHTKNNITTLPTIEEVLWTALRKARLISPPTTEPIENSNKWLHERVPRALDISWEGCQYSKCGRTDRGVSAFGQVIGIRVRSNRPLKIVDDGEVQEGSSDTAVDLTSHGSAGNAELDGLPSIDTTKLQTDEFDTFDPIKDELPYVQILNSILPPDIRILAWCPNPPQDFNARFSCRERRYRYLFTNPAFSPTPGPLGFETREGQALEHREGWLDIEAMREGAKRLIGLHDFRNFCKVDTSKQITNFQRRVFHADVELLTSGSEEGPVSYTGRPGFTARDVEKRLSPPLGMLHEDLAKTPQVYAIVVEGSAFLWHQVRHMAAILFLIGQGLESSELVSELLDVEKNPCRPRYEIATDAPLILWDCVFPKEGQDQHTDSLDWVYAGDARGLSMLSSKGDGKFGLGGIVDDLWHVWHQRKIDEMLAGSLLNQVVGQGDEQAVQRGGYRNPRDAKFRTQRVFDGGDEARLAGKYIPVMRKPRMETIEVQNAKYLAGKGTRWALKRATNAASESETIDVPQ